MKKIILFFLIMLGLNSCQTYKDASSLQIEMGDVFIGMHKNDFLANYGHPFSFNTFIENNDTLTSMSYKTPKRIANKEYIVTTKLQFRNNLLTKIQQDEFFVPQNVIICDSLKCTIVNKP